MEHSDHRQMIRMALEEEARQGSVRYVAGRLSQFLKKGDKVLICLPEPEADDLRGILEEAVAACGGVSVLWGPDLRWKSLLQQAFFSRASVIIGAPVHILGLSKLSRYNSIPLSIRHAVLTGYPCLPWMDAGIRRGMDCKTWGCYCLGTTGVVAGFSCREGLGIHVREDTYEVRLLGAEGLPVEPGDLGEMILRPRAAPELSCPTGENARLEGRRCRCGEECPRLIDLQPGRTHDPVLLELGAQIMSWSSVLDCRLRRGSCGLEMELMVFPGEKLPALPSAARLVIHPFDPKHDKPYPYDPSLFSPEIPWEMD